VLGFVVWIGIVWLRIGSSGGLLSVVGFNKRQEFLDHLSDCQLLRKDLVTWY
jgi:hypothetical protein